MLQSVRVTKRFSAPVAKAALSGTSEMYGEARQRAWNEVSNALFWTLTSGLQFHFADSGVRESYGLPLDDMHADEILDRIHEDDRDAIQIHFERAIADGVSIDVVFRQQNRVGEMCWVRARADRRFGPRALASKGISREDREPLWFGVTEDIHARHVAEAALLESEERLALAVGGTGVGVWDWVIATGKTWLSDKALAIQGFGPGEDGPDMADCDHFVHPEDRPSHARSLADCIAGRVEVAEHEHRLRTQAGGWTWVRETAVVAERDADGRATRLIGTRLDINARKQSENRQRWLAEHDQMTGLFNRPAFLARLDAAVAAALQDGSGLLLIVFDMDDLKLINDKDGHAAGDMVLIGVTDQIRSAAPPNAVVGRLGGDEFALMCPGVASAADARAIVSAIHARTRVLARLSAGGALLAARGEGGDVLLKNADIALYRAKRHARGDMVLYEPEMRAPLNARAAALAAANAALAAGAIRLSYQPRRAVRTGALAGVQVRLCVEDANGALHAPEWLAWAREDANVSDRLSCHMVGIIAGERAAGLLPRGGGEARLSLTASSAALCQPGAADRWLRALQPHGLSADDFNVQVSESVFTGRGAEHGIAAVHTLHAAGARVVLDHFGSGLASLTQLRRVPVRTLRIDARFTQALSELSDDAVIARALLGLGRDLGLETIADGVSERVQLDMLAALRCDVVQGPLIAAPVPADALEQSIAAMLARPLFS